MKRPILFPAVSAVGAVAALVLRFAQNRTGFEPDTGLPIPGNPAGYALLALLVVLGIALFFLVRRLPVKEAAILPEHFATEDLLLITAAVGGIFLMIASGLFALYGGLIALDRSALLQGLISIVASVGLFPAVAACRKREGISRTVSGKLLLLPCLCFVILMVLVYRESSVNPALQSYYVDILAMVFLTAGLLQLSAFAFGVGRPRRFAFDAGAALILGLASVADQPAEGLLYFGCALTLTAFSVMYLQNGALPAAEAPDAPEAPQD